jgi:hypothetical protein
MRQIKMMIAVAATVMLATGCAKKEEATAEAAAAVEAAPAAEAAAPAADAVAPAVDAAATAAKDEDASQSGGDKVRP